MKMLYASMLLTIAGNVLYHASQKSVPGAAHPIVSVVASYLTAIVLTLLLLIAFPLRESVAGEVARLNWASMAVGVAIVAVELGFLLVYRAGWSISLGPVTSNTTVALLLLPIGALMFRERISVTNMVGVAFCLIGLVLVTRKPGLL